MTKVITDDLVNGGDYVGNICNDVEELYTGITDLSVSSCISFESFKKSLRTMIDLFEQNSETLNNYLNNCADDLQDIDRLIGNNVLFRLSDSSTLDFNSDGFKLQELSAISFDNNVDIGNLANLSESERKNVLKELSDSLNVVSTNIQSRQNVTAGVSNNSIVKSLINQYIEGIQENGSYYTNDLIKNNFYNNVVNKYGEMANVTITPNLLHYAGSHGYPLIRENIDDYNLKFNGTDQPVQVGDEYDYYTWGVASGDEKSSYYSIQLHNETGSYERNYSYYPDSQAYHYRSDEWYICDDGFYRDADGYIICADRYNMGYNEDGSRRWGGQITSENAVIVDTPFGPGKVYDWCEEGNIDVYVHH